ncbi:phage integrase [Stutzerimonas nitrititolerans]|uniref:phage integrase n=1 Tax=Stutzerimonas nitrititolerans TaxID=2482751 RepID=UPI00289749B6|nr:tyrosine-type recombinase/integrase [Stutzerimonas nitrititolerans]
MAIEQLPDGRWKVDVEPVKGKRFRKTVKTKAEALRFEATRRAECIQPASWNPKPRDNRKLSELIQQWYKLHGHAITGGRRRANLLQLMAKRLGDPVARKLTGADIVDLRRRELEAGAKPKSVNNRLSFLKTVYNELYRLGDIDYVNPLAKVKPLKLQEVELSFLQVDQIRTLLNALDKSRSSSVRLIAEVCLATGARWSEAQGLRVERVRNDTVTFVKTKSKRVRTVPISPELAARVSAYLEVKGRFAIAMRAFRNALKASGIVLPRGQASHVLRHTFASHFIMNGGDIVTLSKILGHSSLAVTMRYAHLSPSHFKEAVRFNPLDGFDTSSTRAAASQDKSFENQSLGADSL